MRWNDFVRNGLVLCLFLPVSTFVQTGSLTTKPGDILPAFAGKTLTGEQLDLPNRTKGSQAVVIFSFSRAGGRDAQFWVQRLSEDSPHLSVYVAIFLESVPRLFRSLAVSGIRNGMPSFMQDRTILLYQDQTSWEERLRVSDERRASVVVLSPSGRVQWITSGPFTESLYISLKQHLRASNGRE